MKNRWGDPLLVRYPVSKIAVCAFVFAVVAAGCAALLIVLVATELAQNLFGLLGAALLALALLPSALAGIALAYIALLTCRVNDLRPGRGLAWGALAAAYLSLFCFCTLLAALLPILGWLPVAIVVVGVLHIMAFAAESTFARYAVTSSFVGLIFLSLVICALLHAREQSRRLQVQKNLQEIGMHWSAAAEIQQANQRYQPAHDPLSEDASLLQEYLHPALAPVDLGETWRADWKTPSSSSEGGQ